MLFLCVYHYLNSVTEIDQCAFWKCLSLKNISIPNNVTKIGDYAFIEYSSFTIPNSIIENGEPAF